MSAIINSYLAFVSSDDFWGNKLNVTSVADAYHTDGKLIRNAGAGAWDASAFSILSFDRSAGGRLVWDATADQWNALGLGKIDIVGDYTLIEFGYGPTGGAVHVYELGVDKSIAVPAAPNQVCEVRMRSDGRITYWVNQSFIYESSSTAASGVYHAVAAIHEPAHYVDRVQLLALVASFWDYAKGVTIAVTDIVTKIAVAGWENAHVYSTASFVRADGKRMVWAPSSVNNAGGEIVGIDNRGFSTPTFGYEWQHLWIVQSSLGLVWEGSSQKASVSIAADDVLEIRVATDGTVTYWKNNSLIYTSLTTISASVPYFIRGAIYNTSRTIDNVSLIAL